MNITRTSVVTLAIGCPLVLAVLQGNRVSRFEAENERLREVIDPTFRTSGVSRHEAQAPDEKISFKKPYESESAKLARERKAADESIRQQQAAEKIENAKHPRFSLMETGGTKMTAKAAQAAGLSDDQQNAVNDILEKTWVSVTNDLAARASLVEAESNIETGISVYMVFALPDRGKAWRGQLENSLDVQVGSAKLKILMGGLDSDLSLAGFGAKDVRFEFSVKNRTCKFAYLNPLNGEPTCYGSSTFDEFKERFGESFELPDASISAPAR
ncbi:MAG: hypothetical protein V4819_22730 [Verrucomicrobiota bacterium]